MKLATIVPFAYLGLGRFDDYHMVLAHLVDTNPGYERFFREASERGQFVLMDNGVVERGNPMNVHELLARAWRVKATELILPDRIGDAYQTCRMSRQALVQVGNLCQTMAVPQGNTFHAWKECLSVMLDWPVASIGISRFTNAFGLNRLQVLEQADKLLASSKQIHLLGCAGDPVEIWDIEQKWPGRIRGVDSGIASIYAQERLYMRDLGPKPLVELNFHAESEEFSAYLRANVKWWEKRCQGKI